jgi:hypothetical protein
VSAPKFDLSVISQRGSMSACVHMDYNMMHVLMKHLFDFEYDENTPEDEKQEIIVIRALAKQLQNHLYPNQDKKRE